MKKLILLLIVLSTLSLKGYSQNIEFREINKALVEGLECIEKSEYKDSIISKQSVIISKKDTIIETKTSELLLVDSTFTKCKHISLALMGDIVVLEDKVEKSKKRTRMFLGLTIIETAILILIFL